jgi:alpha-L-arabinofuranosidase
MFAKRRDGVALRALVQGPEYEGKSNGRVPYLDVSAILGAGEVHVFASNRSMDSAAPVQVSLADRSIAGLVSAELLTGPNAQAANSYEQPNVVCARPFTDVRIADGRASFELPPLSVAALTLRLG